jgi:hypothetical protein
MKVMPPKDFEEKKDEWGFEDNFATLAEVKAAGGYDATTDTVTFMMVIMPGQAFTRALWKSPKKRSSSTSSSSTSTTAIPSVSVTPSAATATVNGVTSSSSSRTTGNGSSGSSTVGGKTHRTETVVPQGSASKAQKTSHKAMITALQINNNY